MVVFMAIFTSGFRYAEGLESGMFDGLRYWWGQHDVGRGGQPWFFYLVIYAGYEWLLLVAAASGVAVVLWRRSLPGAWFATMAVGHVVLYSWAGEKFAWLAFHPLLPLVLLAGVGAQAVRDRLADAPVRQWATASVAAVAAVLTLVIAVPPAITDGADPSELLVTVQTSDDVPPLARRLRTAYAEREVRSIFVDQTGGGAWPWVWYLHGLDKVGWGTLGIDRQELPDGYDAYIVLALEEPPKVPKGYRLERFRLRVWWVPDYERAGLGDLGRWFLSRRTWSPTASFDQYLVIRDPDRSP
jgi:uncharacterized protein (TIGR03663 family)